MISGPTIQTIEEEKIIFGIINKALEQLTIKNKYISELGDKIAVVGGWTRDKLLGL
jgi:tRNA nucleotidyltransferase (CCA-adding enzyme)